VIVLWLELAFLCLWVLGCAVVVKGAER